MDISTLSIRCTKYDILQYPLWRWDRGLLSDNGNICIAIIDTYMPNAVGLWDWQLISQHIDVREVLSHPDAPWNRDGLSRNKNITCMEEILSLEMPNAVGLWSSPEDLSEEEEVDIEYKLHNPDMPWDWHAISRRVSMQDVLDNPYLPWDKDGLLLNKNIPIEYLKKMYDDSTMPIPRSLYDVEILFS